jgi:short-subunit dehydrogenase
MITGASSAIGRQFALEFAPRSQALLLVARPTERLDRLRVEQPPHLNVITLVADLSDERAIGALLRRIEEQRRRQGANVAFRTRRGSQVAASPQDPLDSAYGEVLC